MGKLVETYHRVFRASDQCAELAAEWSAYWKLPVVANVDGFKIWSWWVAIAPTLPRMAAIARRVLAVPATGCDVERCFSSLKWVKKERQHGMSEETHATAALLHFNGIVPNPTPAEDTSPFIAWRLWGFEWGCRAPPPLHPLSDQ